MHRRLQIKTQMLFEQGNFKIIMEYDINCVSSLGLAGCHGIRGGIPLAVSLALYRVAVIAALIVARNYRDAFELHPAFAVAALLEELNALAIPA